MVLFDILHHAIAMFGYTRAGKTTSCHLLCRSPLKAENKNGELIFVPSTKKF
jgi:50S ribosomal subunit-associated GTPase HflX